MNMTSILRLFGRTSLLVFSSCFLLADNDNPRNAATEALARREAMVAEIGRGSLTASAAIERLKVDDSPTGFKPERNADFAFAALDLALRLVGSGQVSSAEPFFAEADKALTAALDAKPAPSAKDRAMLLQKRALIRANYLNQPAAAKADLEEAAKLQPDDDSVRHKLEMLPGGNSGSVDQGPKK